MAAALLAMEIGVATATGAMEAAVTGATDTPVGPAVCARGVGLSAEPRSLPPGLFPLRLRKITNY